MDEVKTAICKHYGFAGFFLLFNNCGKLMALSFRFHKAWGARFPFKARALFFLIFGPISSPYLSFLAQGLVGLPFGGHWARNIRPLGGSNHFTWEIGPPENSHWPKGLLFPEPWLGPGITEKFLGFSHLAPLAKGPKKEFSQWFLAFP